MLTKFDVSPHGLSGIYDPGGTWDVMKTGSGEWGADTVDYTLRVVLSVRRSLDWRLYCERLS